MPSSSPRKHHRKTSSAATLFTFATLLSSPASVHALPPVTKTVAFREFNVVRSYPFQPTQPPLSPYDSALFRREFNTVCGFIGGDDKLPATCSAGSHCVAEQENGVIGCCPNEGPCTQGIFTSCVDRNSKPQKEINPYVFTCSANSVCYKNKFDGGYFQWGCGSDSALATTVQTKVEDAKENVSNVKTSVHLTADPTSLDKPTTIGSQPRPKATQKAPSEENPSDEPMSGDEDSGSETASSTGSETKTSSEATPTATDGDHGVVGAKGNNTDATDEDEDKGDDDSHKPDEKSDNSDSGKGEGAKDSGSAGSGDPDNSEGEDDDDDDNDKTPVGAIVGGSIGGVAAIALLVSLAIFFLRRRSRKNSKGGYEDGEYITSVNSSTREFRRYRGGFGGPGAGGAAAPPGGDGDGAVYGTTFGNSANMQGTLSPLNDNRDQAPPQGGHFQQLSTTPEEPNESQPYAGTGGHWAAGGGSQYAPLAVAAGAGASSRGADQNQPYRAGSPTPMTATGPNAGWSGNGNPYSAAHWDAEQRNHEKAPAAYGARRLAEQDQEPLTSSTGRAAGNELDSSRRYNEATQDVSPADDRPDTGGSARGDAFHAQSSASGDSGYAENVAQTAVGYTPRARKGNEPPFWQQKTRQSRNLMWM